MPHSPMGCSPAEPVSLSGRMAKLRFFAQKNDGNENYCLILHRIPEVNRLRTHCLKHYLLKGRQQLA